ncbi:MAG: TonB-dependent receptor [candidate division Zixibacteria bacterium]
MELSRLTRGVVGIFCCLSPVTPRTLACHKILILLAILISIGGQALAQSTVTLSGRVFDKADGSPVSGASVNISNSNYVARTDNTGYFHFEHLPVGFVSVTVIAEGYIPSEQLSIEIIPDMSRKLNIYLERKIYNLKNSTIVSSTKSSQSSADVEIINRKSIIESKAEDLGDILDNANGVAVLESGTGGKKTVSIRGCESRHVLVMLNGHPLNNAGDGVADLNSIPLEIIERVEIYRGSSSARFGPGAMGGAVNIITLSRSFKNPAELFFNRGLGKWKTETTDVTGTDIIPNSAIINVFSYNHYRTNGDFHYKYVTLPVGVVESGIRRNAYTVRDNYFISGKYDSSPKSFLTYTGQFFSSKYGLPGPVTQPDDHAYKEDKRILGSAAYDYLPTPLHNIKLTLNASRFEQHYNNIKSANPFKRTENQSFTDKISFDALDTYLSPNLGDLQWGIALRQDRVDHKDLFRPTQSMGKTVRSNGAVFVSLRKKFEISDPGMSVTFNGGLRHDYNRTSNENHVSQTGENHLSSLNILSKKIGLAISTGKKIRMTLRGNYGTSFQLPALVALFWKSDAWAVGNPLLRPERSEQSEAGFEIEYEGKIDLSAGITYFHNHIKDIIVWRLTSPGFAWKPVNLDAARITGHEDFIRLGLFSKRLEISYQNTVLVPKNKTASSSNHNMDLTYRPRYTTTIQTKLTVWKAVGQYSIRLVDKRYSLDANTKWYDAYRIDDCYIALKLNYSNIRIETVYRIKNLRDENYTLIGQFPMPGRDWSIDLSLTYRFPDKSPTKLTKGEKP